MSEPFEQTLQSKYQELCLAVGHLFITFARLETSLASLLKLHLAHAMGNMLDIEKVKLSSAIYGGMRYGAARDVIKRLAAVEGVANETVDFAIAAFAHIGHIQDLRDKIAHHLTVPAYAGADHYWQITDAPVTRDIRNPKVYVFESAALVHAAADLTIAAQRFGGPATSGHVLQALEQDLSPFPWRYRPSMLKLVPQSKLRSPEGPFRQPQSSP